jgi:hypothetical protein
VRESPNWLQVADASVDRGAKKLASVLMASVERLARASRSISAAVKRVPRGVRIAYGIGWVLTSAWLLIPLALSTDGSIEPSYVIIPWIGFWAVLGGAVWPVTATLTLWSVWHSG